MQQKVMVLCVTCVTALWIGMASANPSYQFAFDQSNYLVAPGAKVDVKVYWEEDQGILNPSGGTGLYGLGTTIRFDDSPQPVNLAQVLATSDIAYNPAFNDTGSILRNVSATYARLAETTTVFPGNVYGDVVSGDLRKVWLGTFSFTGASTPGVTHIRAARYQLTTEGDYIMDDDFNVWDTSTLEATATVTTTSEPSTLVLGSMAALAILAFRCWSKGGRI